MGRSEQQAAWCPPQVRPYFQHEVLLQGRGCRQLSQHALTLPGYGVYRCQEGAHDLWELRGEEGRAVSPGAGARRTLDSSRAMEGRQYLHQPHPPLGNLSSGLAFALLPSLTSGRGPSLCASATHEPSRCCFRNPILPSGQGMGTNNTFFPKRTPQVTLSLPCHQNTCP